MGWTYTDDGDALDAVGVAGGLVLGILLSHFGRACSMKWRIVRDQIEKVGEYFGQKTRS